LNGLSQVHDCDRRQNGDRQLNHTIHGEVGSYRRNRFKTDSWVRRQTSSSVALLYTAQISD